jgi:hypothetical protein
MRIHLTEIWIKIKRAALALYDWLFPDRGPSTANEDENTKKNSVRESFEYILRSTEIEDITVSASAEDEMLTDIVSEFKTKHIYYIKGDRIKIKLNVLDNRCSTISITKVQKTKNLKLIIDENKVGVVSRVEYGSMKLDVTCAHVVANMSDGQSADFSSINPMVYTTKRAANVNTDGFVGKYDQAHILTCNSKTNEHFYIQTRPIVMINGIIQSNGRSKKTTLGVIMQFVCPNDLIMSGTVARIGTSIFVLSSRHRAENVPYTTFVAWAVLEHDYISEIL